MRFYRVTHVAPNWHELTPADNGHPFYVHRMGQGRGRFDLPQHYVGLYLGRQPQAAVGEVFQNLSTWTATEITRRRTVDNNELPRCLVSIETGREFFDLDDAAVLNEMGWRPSDVVGKDRSKTHQLALTQWLRRSEHGKGGFMWWSSCNPSWTVAMAWNDIESPGYDDMEVLSVEPLRRDHPAVVAAAEAMKRKII